MNDIDRLIAIESIRNIKATYWYAIDVKDWDLLATVFDRESTVDFRRDRDFKPGQPANQYPPVEQALAEGDNAVAKGDKIATWIRDVAMPLRTVHHGHAPIIEIDGPDRARAIWPMFDYVDSGSAVIKGYGHYHETYGKAADGRWVIRTLVLTRLRIDGNHPASYAQS